jgi:hypothetical protein
MALTKNFTGFGIRDLAVALMPAGPGGSPVWKDVPLIEQAEFKLDVKEQELWGDDRYAGTFYHSATGKITAKANRIAMNILEMLSGVDGVSNVDGSESVYFGTEAELLPPRVMVRAIVPVRNADGTAGLLTVYWFSTEVKTLWENLPGSSRAKIMEVNFVFNVFASEVDETNTPLPVDIVTAFGRIDVE